MPLDASVLTSTKKILGVGVDDDAFDTDIITHINAAFSTLEQLGVGPEGGFQIEDAEATWDAFTDNVLQQNMVKSLVYFRVRLGFDPPATSFAIAALEKLAEELTWRINVRREADEWVDPIPPPDPDEDEGGPLIIDGGGA